MVLNQKTAKKQTNTYKRKSKLQYINQQLPALSINTSWRFELISSALHRINTIDKVLKVNFNELQVPLLRAHNTFYSLPIYNE